MQTIVAIMNKEWNNFIINISWENADLVRQLWLKLIAIIPNIRIPQAGLSSDEQSFFFIWDDGKHYLDIELFDNAQLDWFYLNRENNILDGSEEPTTLTIELISYLERYAI